MSKLFRNFDLFIILSLITAYSHLMRSQASSVLGNLEDFSSVNTTRTTLLDIDKNLAFCGSGKINLREVTLTRLQNALTENKVTSFELVQCYIKRIQAIDPYLHSVLEINPDAEIIAKLLDKTRIPGTYHGPLYGIPILLKDNIGTDDRMETTAGSIALLGIKPKKDSRVVKKLRLAGAIILGKANLEEFAGDRTLHASSGWSGRGGRTSNAYVLSANASGSSSGSAVAVAANLVPVALGTETCGSIVAPSGVASLVGLKTTVRRVSTAGVIPLDPKQDVVGPLTRTVSDAALVFSVISKNGFNHPCFSHSTMMSGCRNLNFRVGVPRDSAWSPSTSGEQETLNGHLPRLNEILKIMRTEGITLVDPVMGIEDIDDKIPLTSVRLVGHHAFKSALNWYLRTKVRNNVVITTTGVKTIRNLADIVSYNDRHPEAYDQDTLKATQATDGIRNRTYIAERVKNLETAELYLNYLFLKYSIDALVIPTTALNQCENPPTRVAAISGYPYVTIPAGFDSRGVPFGISFLGPPNSEESLLILAYKVERVVKARKPSQFLP